MVGDAAVVGAGPAGLMAAEVLAAGGAAVTIYDHMPSIGRKMLMAGRGGLNLTHTEPLETFLGRYRGGGDRLATAVRRWSPEALRLWCGTLGQDTFVGSSGRVFPIAMKASPLLRAWRNRLEALGVRFALRHRWTGWDAAGHLLFGTPTGPVAADPAATVLALGGASWPRLGSDGRWADTLAGLGLAVEAFAPSNCGAAIAWSPMFLSRHEGAPLKSVAVACGAAVSRGDMVVTRGGLEGGALYPLSAPLRLALTTGEPVMLRVALRPDLTAAGMSRRLGRRRAGESLATWLRHTLRLAPVAIGLLQEAAHASAGSPLSGMNAEALADRINDVRLPVTGLAALDGAISSAGGLAFAELDDGWMLRRKPGVFAAGEMLDWEAPTGGYLLQGCFATGRAAGQGALAWLGRVNRG